MSVDEIKGLPVEALALPDAFLFLWTTNRYLGAAFDVMTAWGFRYAQAIIWAKDRSNGLPAAIAC